MPSTQGNKTLKNKVVIGLNDINLYIDIRDNDLGARWLQALADNLRKKRVLEKNFCWIGWASHDRDLQYLCDELNKSIKQINGFRFDPPYDKIHPFVPDDFQYSKNLTVGRGPENKGLRLKHEACNLLHRYFEDLQGTAWDLSPYYKQADHITKYAIRQLNNLCHEIEGWVDAYRKTAFEPEWMRASQITTFLNSPRYDLHDDDYNLFIENRYDRELGGVYLHWSQIGKTLFEVFRDEGAPKLTESLCSAITHQKFYSGEFDIEWGQTITEKNHEFKFEEMEPFRHWLKENGYDWDDPKLSLGYIKLGQVNLLDTFGTEDVIKIHDTMNKNLNIQSIEINGDENVACSYPYRLGDDAWRQMQLAHLKEGYESRNMR